MTPGAPPIDGLVALTEPFGGWPVGTVGTVRQTTAGRLAVEIRAVRGTENDLLDFEPAVLECVVPCEGCTGRLGGSGCPVAPR
ncbi:MAG: hypothetical protein HZB46_18355 [Solirubrobacterales bacterium]|nr:hypothetical protein [Solirubrobacterales bacterium]